MVHMLGTCTCAPHYIVVITLTLHCLFSFCTWSFIINIFLVTKHDHCFKRPAGKGSMLFSVPKGKKA